MTLSEPDAVAKETQRRHTADLEVKQRCLDALRGEFIGALVNSPIVSSIHPEKETLKGGLRC
jgi:hypothetical protein